MKRGNLQEANTTLNILWEGSHNHLPISIHGSSTETHSLQTRDGNNWETPTLIIKGMRMKKRI